VDTPQITVAIPTYNGARHLAEAVRSIRAQAIVAFDWVACDDRSDDATPEILRAEAGDRIRVVVNSERLGLARNWNECVAQSRTPLVAIFHQDDVMHPGHLSAHLSAFEADPGAGLICSAADVIDEEGLPIPESVMGRGGLGPSDRTFGPGELLAELAVENPLRCSAVTIRRQAHAEVGGFDPSYRYVVDWDFWLRVATRYPLTWLARPSVAVRWHSASETHRFKTGMADLQETSRLLLGLTHLEDRGVPCRDRRRPIDRRLARAYLNRAYDALRGGDPSLARRCLAEAVSLRPGILRVIALDPRLAAMMATLAVAPEIARRLFSRTGRDRPA